MAVLKEDKLKIFHVFVYSFEVNIVCLRIELNKMGIHTIVVFKRIINSLKETSELLFAKA